MPRPLQKIVALLWGLVLFVFVILAFYVSWMPTTPADWLALISTIALFGNYLYRQWSWLNLHVQKIWLWLLNTTVHWSLDIRLELAEEELSEEDISSSVENELVEKYRDVIRIDRRESLDFHFNIQRQLSARVLVTRVLAASVYESF